MAAEIPSDPAEAGPIPAVAVATKVPPVPAGRPVPPTDVPPLVKVPEVAAMAPSLVIPEMTPVLAEAVLDRHIHEVAPPTAAAAAPSPRRPVPAASAQVRPADIVAVVIVEVLIPVAQAEVLQVVVAPVGLQETPRQEGRPEPKVDATGRRRRP